MNNVKQLGTITFGMNSMFVDEAFSPDSVMSEAKMSVAGTHIVYEAEIVTPYITLNSIENSWITAAQKTELETMWNTLGAIFTLTYDDDTTVTVRMAREKKLRFTPLYEGGCDYYQALIPLAKV